jgi:uncharacterized RDD family membrane protein YckC
MRLTNHRCDNRTRSDASVLVRRILFRSLIVACMLLDIFQTTTVNTKQKQDTHGMRLANDRCDNQTRSDASVLVWRFFFRSFIVACMLLDIFHTTNVNTKQKQDTHGMRLGNNQCENRSRSDASMLVWRFFFRSFIVACMLLELYQTTAVNTKQKQGTHGMRLANDRCNNRTMSDASVLVWTLSFRSIIQHMSAKSWAPGLTSGRSMLIGSWLFSMCKQAAVC